MCATFERENEIVLVIVWFILLIYTGRSPQILKNSRKARNLRHIQFQHGLYWRYEFNRRRIGFLGGQILLDDSMSEIQHWLEQYKLGEYADLFAENRIDLDVLQDLEEEDLKDLGIPLGDRKRLLKAAQVFKSEQFTQDFVQSGEQVCSSPSGEAERRQLTVMFTDLVGSTSLSESMDPEEYRGVLTAYQSAASKAIQQYGGYIARYMGDGLLVYFGYPQAHEDDTERAVRAGLEIIQDVTSLSPRPGLELQVRTGLETGLVVVGDIIGEGASEESAVLGDTPNLAARLQTLAEPNTVIIGPGAQRLIEGLFRLESLGKRQLKGISTPVSAFQVVGASDARSRFEATEKKGFSKFTGRERELAVLSSCLEKTIGGEGQFVTVTGEAGLGKSRLLYEFRHNLDRNNLTVLQGRCQSYGATIPYLPLINALRRGLRLNEEDSLDHLREKTITNLLAIDASLEEYLPIFLHLLSIESETYPLPIRLQGPELADAIREAYAAIFSLNTMEKPMVVLLEDWHWADTASNKVLKHLINVLAAYPLMFIVTYRPEYSAEWGTRSYHTPIVLQHLGNRDTKTLAKAVWQADDLPEKLVSIIHDRTGGNPFFVEQVCEALFEDGTVTRENGQVVLTRDIERISVPGNVEAVIRSRLDRLDKHVRETLSTASVIGREFAQRILERVSKTQTSQLNSSLDLLQTIELVRQVRLVPEAAYVFKHVLTQEVTYETLLLQRRKELHGLIGRAIENLYAERIDEQVELLVHHFSLAEDWEKAVTYARMAGEKANKLSQFLDSVEFYKHAIQWMSNLPKTRHRPEELIDLYTRLIWDYSALGRWEEAQEVYCSAEPTAAELGDRVRLGFLCSAVGMAYQFKGDAKRAETLYQQALDHMEAEGDEMTIGTAKHWLGSASLGPGRWMEASKLITQALNTYEKFELLTSYLPGYYLLTGIIAYAQVGYCLAIQGRNREAAEHFAKAASAEFQTVSNLMSRTIYISWHGLYVALVGNDRLGATLHADQLLEIAKKSDSPFQQLGAYVAKTNCLVGVGDYSEVKDCCENAIKAISGRNIRTGHVANLYYNFALAQLELGDIDAARRSFEEGMPIAETSPHWWGPRYELLKGLLAISKPEPNFEQAETCFERSIAADLEVNALVPATQTRYRLATLLARRGDSGRARGVLNELMEQFHQWAIPTWERKCKRSLTDLGLV